MKTETRRKRVLPGDYDRSAAWRVSDLATDTGWRFELNDRQAQALAETAKKAHDPDRELFDYDPDEFDFGSAFDVIRDAAREAYWGKGLALVKNLPRAALTAEEFRTLNWGIGLRLGVARPQGKATQYMSEVRNTGTNYRAANGRGYSSNARLDFHADSCDLVTLSCFNKAKSGGRSMISSSMTAYEIMSRERPDLAEVACGAFTFSRNQEEAPDEGPHYDQPLFDYHDGRFFGKWNRNRVRTAQEIAGVRQMTAEQRDCTDLLDEILQRPDVMYSMYLEPGDLQLMNNHVLLHSRTTYEDFDEPERQRLLYRLWLAPVETVALPENWRQYYRSVEPGTVRGGIRGHCHDDRCKAWESRQAAHLGMPEPEQVMAPTR
jgi:hypothetical protein